MFAVVRQESFDLSNSRRKQRPLSKTPTKEICPRPPCCELLSRNHYKQSLDRDTLTDRAFESIQFGSSSWRFFNWVKGREARLGWAGRGGRRLGRRRRRRMKEMGGRWRIWIGLVLVCCCSLVDALRFELPASSTKCIAEDIQPHVLVLGDYGVVSAADASHLITARVTSPSGKQLHFSENIQIGQFAFTTEEGGNFMACFWMQHAAHNLVISIDLDWKTGVAAKDWVDIAKKEKLDDMQVELMKLEEAVEAIHAEMLVLREREKEMRDLNESTNARVAWFSIMSLFICLGVAGWQLWHLKSFFERKKLL